MSEETNKPTKADSAEETVRKLVPIDEEAKADEGSTQVVNSASQSPNRSEETPVVRKLVVPDTAPSDPDDDRSPGLVGRSVGGILKPEEKSQLETEADEADESKE